MPVKMRTGFVCVLYTLWLVAAACGTARLPLPAPVVPLVSTQDLPLRTHPPQLPAAEVAAAPEFQTVTLANGLSIWVLQRPGQQHVSLSLVERSLGDLRSTCSAEVTRLTARAIVEGGTIWLNGRTVEPPKINGYGVTWSSHNYGARFNLEVLRKSLDAGVLVLARTLRYPALAAGQLDPVRLMEMKALQNGSSLRPLLTRLATGKTFGDAFAERYVPTRIELVHKADDAAIIKCYRENVVPDHSALIVVGDVTLAEVRELVSPLLGDWIRSGQPLPPVQKGAALAESGRMIHWVPSDERNPQASVVVVQPAPASEASNDELPFELLAQIAVGSFHSRSNTQLRHGAGFTYGVRPNLLVGPGFGLLTIAAEFETDNTGRAIESVLAMLEDLTKKPVTDGELNEAKQIYIASHNDRIHDDDRLVAWAGQLFELGRSPDWSNRVREQLQTITKEDLLRVAKKYLRPEHVDIAVHGPVRLHSELDAIGDVVPYYVRIVD
jgi:zinc protease